MTVSKLIISLPIRERDLSKFTVGNSETQVTEEDAFLIEIKGKIAEIIGVKIK
ncbi:MAG: hypothetical protein ACJASQ_001385 [Crocinitomicaceae bacterium]|jgi:hypothetical protein